MRIGIDCHILGKRKGGVETVVEALVRGLARHDADNTYFLYVTDKHPFQPGDLPANFHLRFLQSPSPTVGRLLLLPRCYQRDRLDVIHLQRVVAFWGCPHTLLHVHDAMFATNPELFPAWRRALLNQLFRWSCQRAARVVTPTEASKADIVQHYACNPSKIEVLPAGSVQNLYPEVDSTKIDSVLELFGARHPYLIFLGAMERNKNVHLLVQAFAEFVKEQPGYRLVLVGQRRAQTKGGYVEEVVGEVARLGIQDKVTMTGWVSNEQRRLLLCGAAALVFPSAAEGLGLPPIEAMACGVPVIASDVPSIREFYGDAVLSARANDASHLAARMLELISNPGLARELVARGLERSRRDHWANQPARLLEIYRLTAGSPACQPASSR
ncbi:MAG: glycosyltransferase family 1 protein [Luteolibacter sp.]